MAELKPYNCSVSNDKPRMTLLRPLSKGSQSGDV